ncbi:hypothetical protein SAMN05192575_10940 [Nocardioides alpinus]|uniref:Uncharacterized protein n=1 Tax=Nocardioides alpinus TaxID=748909 RepID=A0A1I1AHB7_9ACTN|nr:hypothetical protein [Nocardioides alpinus]PKH41014.1 hypothetical protein CXG46_11230 [Nocardioides alpinus]SFB37337.1 hypothetical protein SAMN05192575_10940 [Nocardioides alpinus]
MQKKAVIGGVAAAAVVVGLGTWWAVDRSVEAQTTERGTCGGATWELSAEAEDGGTEVSAELQSSGPGEVWQVELVRDDTALLTGERTTDEDGEIDVDAFSNGNPGDATYSVTFTPADGETCTATLGS